MFTQLLAAAATLLGWAGSWTVGNGRRAGWLAGAAACGLWLAVNTALGLAAGIVSAAVGGALAIRNWRASPQLCAPPGPVGRNADMAKIGTAHVEIKPVVDEAALAEITRRVADAVAAGVALGMARTPNVPVPNTPAYPGSWPPGTIICTSDAAANPGDAGASVTVNVTGDITPEALERAQQRLANGANRIT